MSHCLTEARDFDTGREQGHLYKKGRKIALSLHSEWGAPTPGAGLTRLCCVPVFLG